MPTLIEGNKLEKGCAYYRFTLNKEGNLLVCREAYVNGEAVKFWTHEKGISLHDWPSGSVSDYKASWG
jgi:hypothetical protein